MFSKCHFFQWCFLDMLFIGSQRSLIWNNHIWKIIILILFSYIRNFSSQMYSNTFYTCKDLPGHLSQESTSTNIFNASKQETFTNKNSHDNSVPVDISSHVDTRRRRSRARIIFSLSDLWATRHQPASDNISLILKLCSELGYSAPPHRRAITLANK